MEHQGVRYTIRAAVESNVRLVAIHSGGVESAAKRVNGSREDAESEARSMIDRCLHERGGRNAERK
jgi:hypothetical protein